MTRPPAPWMRDLKITTLQKEAKQHRVKAHRTENDEDWKEYRSTKNKLKKEINPPSLDFTKKLSPLPDLNKFGKQFIGF